MSQKIFVDVQSVLRSSISMFRKPSEYFGRFFHQKPDDFQLSLPALLSDPESSIFASEGVWAFLPDSVT